MITMRPASMDDADLLLEWRNDPVTRANSKTTNAVQRDAHISWLTARLQRDQPNLYVAEDDEPVGTIRIDGDEVSYTVAPEHRGKGYATTMLIWARERFGVLRAEIKLENIASIRAAAKAGHVVVIIDAGTPASDPHPWKDANHWSYHGRPTHRCPGCRKRIPYSTWGAWCHPCNVRRMTRMDRTLAEINRGLGASAARQIKHDNRHTLSPMICDLPTAWRIQSDGIDHGRSCASVPGWHVLSGPEMLCDCGAVLREWTRRAALKFWAA